MLWQLCSRIPSYNWRVLRLLCWISRMSATLGILPVLLESLEEGTADVMTELSLSLLEGAKPPLAWLAGTRKGMPPAPEVRRARYIQTCT